MNQLQEASKAKEKIILKQLRDYADIAYITKDDDDDTKLWAANGMLKQLKNIDPTSQHKYLQPLVDLLKKEGDRGYQFIISNTPRGKTFQDALQKFHNGKNQFKSIEGLEQFVDINQFDGIAHFIQVVNKHIEDKLDKDEVLAKDTKKLYSDDQFVIFTIGSVEAAQYTCGGAKFCIKNASDYSHYADKTLVMVLNKNASTEKTNDGEYKDPSRKVLMAIDDGGAIVEIRDAWDNTVTIQDTFGDNIQAIKAIFEGIEVEVNHERLLQFYAREPEFVKKILEVFDVEPDPDIIFKYHTSMPDLFINLIRPYIEDRYTRLERDGDVTCRYRGSIDKWEPYETIHQYKDRIDIPENKDTDELFSSVKEGYVHTFLGRLVQYPALWETFIDIMEDKDGITFEAYMEDEGINLATQGRSKGRGDIGLAILAYGKEFNRPEIEEAAKEACRHGYKQFMKILYPPVFTHNDKGVSGTFDFTRDNYLKADVQTNIFDKHYIFYQLENSILDNGYEPDDTGWLTDVLSMVLNMLLADKKIKGGAFREYTNRDLDYKFFMEVLVKNDTVEEYKELFADMCSVFFRNLR